MYSSYRRGDGWLERAVRGRSAYRRTGRDRDESACLAIECAREQGDRVPDREDRGQARGRLPARRSAQRHHARDAGVVRADHRLRRHEDPALGVREAPGLGAGARHADAVGGRGDGDRAHVRRVAPEGAAFARDRPLRAQLRSRRTRARRFHRRRAGARGRGARRRNACSRSRPRCGDSSRSSASTRPPVSIRGSATRYCRSSRNEIVSRTAGSQR